MAPEGVMSVLLPSFLIHLVKGNNLGLRERIKNKKTWFVLQAMVENFGYWSFN